MMAKDRVHFSQRILSVLLSSLLATQPILPAIAATITPSGGTQMDKAGNGVPVVNIATPNTSGISHNKYQDYNVGKEGLILNNATGKLNQTQLGGLIQNNPHLKAGQEAKGIINEVTGTNRSQLQGYTEVAGKAANVIVANPYGITCNGCGFINTPNATLTTGKPVLDANGKLQSLDVTKGSITIEGQGLDGSQSDAVSIIARATEINAALHAKDLNVTAGANRVGADGSVTGLKGEGATPKVAIDTGALGGMYANRIHLVSGEKGVGVNVGNLTARQGDITLNSAGKLVVKNSLASGNTTVTGTEITLSGEHKAGSNMTAHGQTALTLDNTQLAADKNLQLTTDGKLTQNGGSLTAGVDASLTANRLSQRADAQAGAGRNLTISSAENAELSGKNVAKQDATVNAKTLTTGTQLTAARHLSLNASQKATLNGSVAAGQQLTVKGGALTQSGSLSAADITLSGQTLNQANGSQTSATGNIALTTTGAATLKGSAVAGKSLSVNSASLDNGATLAAGTKASVKTGTLVNSGTVQGNSMDITGTDMTSSGSLKSASTLDIHARNATLSGDNGATGKATITLSGKLDNRGRLISDSELMLSAGQIANSGTLSGGQGLGVSTDIYTATAASVLHSEAALSLSAREATLAGETSASGLLTVNGNRLKTLATAQTQGESVNVDVLSAQLDGTQVARGALTLKVSDSLIHSGKTSATTLKADGTSLTNSGTLLASDVDLNAQSVVNTGTLEGRDAFTLQTGTLDNQSGATIVAPKTTISGVSLMSAGMIQGTTLKVSAGQQLNNSGVLSAPQLTLRGSEMLNSGVMQGDDVALYAGNLTSNGTLSSNGALIITADNVTQKGKIGAKGDTQLIVSNTFANTGELISDNGMTVTAGNIHQNGTLTGAKNLSIHAADVTTGAGSLTQSAGALTMNADAITLAGEVWAGGDLAFTNTTLNTLDGALTQSDGSLSLSAEQASLAGTQIAAKNLDVDITNALNHSGKSRGTNATIGATTLSNSGTLLADALSLTANTLDNSGALAGTDTLKLNTSALTNQAIGSVYSAGDLTLNIPQITNKGVLTSDKTLALNTTTLDNGGQIAADSLTVKSTTLSGNGLLQGATGLSVAGDTLSQGQGARWLSAGNVDIFAGKLLSEGTTQGQDIALTATEWTHKGSLLAQGQLTATLAGLLSNSGELLSQSMLTLTSDTFRNSGNVLAVGQMLLSGNTLNNGGALQGDTLTLEQNSIDNTGTMIGLKSLRLHDKGALNNSGKLLSQGALTTTATDVINSGSWQASTITLTGNSLNNTGALQSANSLQLTLEQSLTGAQNSKITALGEMTLDAAALDNAGLWSASTVTLSGDSLKNSGEISGVNGLDIDLAGTLTQQGKLLTGGSLNIGTTALTNSGQIQGNQSTVKAKTLENSGRLQGNTLTLALIQALTNQASGTILSQKTLNVTAPQLINDGVMQGNGITTLTANQKTVNNGRLLSGSDLTLTTPDYSGQGTLQATNLLLNVASFVNAGTTVAGGTATLTGSRLTNSGLFQAEMLNINVPTLDNSGTLLGKNTLAVKSTSVTQESGKLYSGGDLRINATALTGVGELVAMGNLTATLINAFISEGVVAAGQQLTMTSQGDITNNHTLQGNGLTLNAGGRLVNNGSLTAGSGKSTLSGRQILLDTRGSLQAGGDVALDSVGDITLNGFTGTAGSLTLNTAGTLLNAALLYAGQNMKLFANRIHNQAGDILAGDSLWMQKDASGAANQEVVNTSGTIETQRGDITVNTGSLLNQRDGFIVNTVTHSYASGTDSQLNVPFASMSADQIGIDSDSICTGGVNTHCRTYYSLVPLFGSDEKTILISETKSTVTSDAIAGRLSSAGNLTVNADYLKNEASQILANGNIVLRGQNLENTSAEVGTHSTYQKFTWNCGSHCYKDVDPFPEGQTVARWLDAMDRDAASGILYTLSETWTEDTTDGQSYRAVIQAGGTVMAAFTNTISNAKTTDHAGNIIPALIAPDLNAPSFTSPGNGVSLQKLSDMGEISLTQPDWQDITHSALQDISAHTDTLSVTGKPPVSVTGDSVSSLVQSGLDTGLYPLPSGNNGYFVPASDPDSPYLITVNPKLDGLGQLNQSYFNDLYSLLGVKPGTAPRETNPTWTDQNQFLGSSYFLDRLNLNADNDYRFLGDAAFDTRYASNYVLNQTGSRYINGTGSDLDQMRYLIDSAAEQQKSLGLQFGVALTDAQVASLDKSLIWWESATVNGQTVMVPKVYLSPKDVTIHNGSVISGNNVQLTSNTITNSGSTLTAQNGLTLDSSNSISNLNAGLVSAGGGLNLSALGDINNVGSTISGKTVQLESVGGSINNITQAQQWDINATSRNGNITISGTDVGQTATISATDSLAMRAGQDINVTGAAVQSGGSLTMAAGNDITVSANQVSEGYSQSGFRRVTATSNSAVTNQGSTITAGSNLAIQAGNDLNVIASNFDAGGSALLTAAHDLNLNAAANSSNTQNGGSETHRSGVDSTTLSAGDNLTLAAGQDITSQAAGMAAENDVTLQAGRDVNLQAEASVSGSSSHEKKKNVIDESVRQQGTEIASGGNTTIIAGQDVNAQAAQVTAQGDIGIGAGRDINLTTATESDYHYYEQTKTKKGFLSKKTTHTIEEDSATREAGTLLSGNNVTAQAGNNLLVKGSNVVGDSDVSLHGGNNVDILAATNSDTSWRFKETKKSGLMGSGGIGFTIGSNKTTHDLREQGTTQSQSFSTVGSTGGSVDISAGNQAHISGADLIAGKNLSLSGDSVVIDPGHDKRTRDEKFEQKSSGLTVALSGAVGGAINNAVSAAKEAKNESDSRLAALKTTKAALSGYQASQGYEQAQASADPNNGVGISISLNTQKSKSQQHQESDAVTGSTLNAGNDLSVIATGKKGGINSGDILIGGSQLKAGGNTQLSAQNDILLSGAANTQKTTGSNSSSGGGVGVSFGVGNGSAGLSVFASVNGAKGNEKGDGTEWTETTVDSGGTTTLSSGRDTTLAGAQVSGNTLIADVGRNLWLSSLQDSNNYHSKQESFGAGGSFTFGSMTGSGYINASQDKIKSTYDSVQEQTGLYAGKGGYDVTVGNHTQLDGAVIASTATADKNSLDTGTLGFSDIHNEADYKVSHSGISVSGGNGVGAGTFSQQAAMNGISNATSTLLAGLNGKGHAAGTTQAAVSEGNITVRDGEKQQQDIAALSRDTEHANDSISPIFDKEKEQKRLQAAQLAGELSGQIAEIVRTEGDIKGLKAAEKDNPLPENATEQQRQDWLKALRASDKYQETMKLYGTGSTLQMAAQSVSGVVAGLAVGNLKRAIADGMSPAMAQLIKAGTTDANGKVNEAANTLAHALWGGIAAEVAGGNAAAGAAGAASGELAARYIAKKYYGADTQEKVDALTESDRQMLSMLGTIAAGIAGGVVADNQAGTTTAAKAGKNAAENNALSKKDKINIFDINPMLKVGIEGADGDPLKGGGGIAKYTINKGQQNKHIEGTNEYKTAAASSGSQRSILTVDPQSLLPQLGTGQQVGKVEVGLAGSKERIDFGKPIGNFVDRDTGLSVPTTKGIVHYGKDGAHIVPARP